MPGAETRSFQRLHRARPVPETDLVLMRRLAEMHLAHPFAGARMLPGLLTRDGHRIGRKRVRTLMARPPSQIWGAFLICSSALVGLAVAEWALWTIEPYGGFGAAREIEWVRKSGQEV
jgi:hypothetical protein